MGGLIVSAAPWWAGVFHRFIVLNHLSVVAGYYGYRVRFLWGVSGGVSYCRYEELLSPVPGIQILNVPEPELMELEKQSKSARVLRCRGLSLPVFRAGRIPGARMFAFDQHATRELERLVPPDRRPSAYLYAPPSPPIRRKAGEYIRRYRLHGRVGIRVRVTECPIEIRKPHRIKRELDDAIRSIIRLPRHTRVFLVTDSQYVQQMLASHFYDAVSLPKSFDHWEAGTRYVHRHDKAAMITFLTEVECLMACHRIVNLGGFLNQAAVRARTLDPPYDRAAA